MFCLRPDAKKGLLTGVKTRGTVIRYRRGHLGSLGTSGIRLTIVIIIDNLVIIIDNYIEGLR